MPNLQRFANVDGLRLLCALAVLLFHYGYRGSLEGLYPPLLPWQAVSDGMKYGHIGVHIFFCISGFVIAYSAAASSARVFAVSRFARIYPTFILCLTLLFGVRLFWGAPELPVSLMQYLAGLAILAKVFHQDFLSGVYWSIVVEILFYVWVFAFLVLGWFGRFNMGIIVAWLGVSAVNELVLQQSAIRMLFVTEFAPYFAFGMLLQRLQAKTGSLAAELLTMGFAVALGVAVLLRETADIRSTYHIAISDGVSVAVLLLGLLALVWAVEVKSNILSAKILSWAGGVSYPLYLLHEGMGQVAFVRLQGRIDGPWLFAATAMAVLVLASAIWWLFDRPVMPLLRTWLLSQTLPRAGTWKVRPSRL